jgi:hypothetical protein
MVENLRYMLRFRTLMVAINNIFVLFFSMKRFLILLLLTSCLLSASFLKLFASKPDAAYYTVSGHVTDAKTGEELIGASIYVKELGTGTVSNQYGFYSISLTEGNFTLGYSYVGYKTFEKTFTFQSNLNYDVELIPDASILDEVVVTAEKKNSNVSSLETGTIKLPIQSIRKIPALMGEVDVIKAIQLLPGVQSTSEGSSGYSVRGGSMDQNLILLDEATVYNASHFIGFFSVFNNDAIKDVKLYKGDIPASSGGRLASLLDVRMKDGNTKQFSGKGGIGLISSRLTLEGPVIDNNTSFLLAGRRTYADIFLPFAANEDIQDNKIHFYDLNMKVNHIFNENNRMFISAYFGRDVFENIFAGMNFGNKTITMRWNHLFSPKLFSNFSLIYSLYDYKLFTPENQPNAFEWKSNLKDHSVKADFIYYANPLTTYKFGYIATYHNLNPGLARGLGDENIFTEFRLPENFALQHGAYFQAEEKIGYRISVKYGLRLSVFQNFGEATVYNYDDNYNATDSTVYKNGEFFNTYAGLEPRLGLNYSFNDENSIKASYSRTRQYLQLAQNSTAGTPLDIWFPASPNVKPQLSDQVSLGYFRNFRNNSIETSVEAYYKKMRNTIDFKDHANLLLNPKLEGEIRVGEAQSYGLEFMINITENKFNGWISYTLSKTERNIDAINNGNAYFAPYDKPHDIAVVLNYQLTKRLLISGNWIYSTGLPTTFPTGRFEVLGEVIPVYSDRNADRFPNYHRMDLSVTLTGKDKPNKRFKSEWNLSIYNLYNRKNAWDINFVPDENNSNITYAEKTYLFPIIPALTYNFSF